MHQVAFTHLRGLRVMHMPRIAIVTTCCWVLQSVSTTTSHLTAGSIASPIALFLRQYFYCTIQRVDLWHFVTGISCNSFSSGHCWEQTSLAQRYLLLSLFILSGYSLIHLHLFLISCPHRVYREVTYFTSISPSQRNNRHHLRIINCSS